MTSSGCAGHSGGTRPVQTRKKPKKALSLMSYTRRYVSLADLGRLCQVGLRYPMHSCRIHRVCIFLWEFTSIARKGSHEMSQRSHTETQMSIPIQCQWSCSALSIDTTGVWTAQLCNLSPFTTKNIKSTILYYNLHQEAILYPSPQCITVRYRKSNWHSWPTRENL